jgi:hypothetical protein
LALRRERQLLRKRVKIYCFYLSLWRKKKAREEENYGELEWCEKEYSLKFVIDD